MATASPIRIGRYVLHGELAAGGMAAVHFGRLIGTGGFVKTVAIKRLHRQFVRDERFTDSIIEEGKLAARIRHPNVVPPLDVLSEGGELLLVMEYVHGEALSKLLRAAWNRDESVPITIAIAIMSNVLHGLHAAHEAKDEKGRPLDIVHRDVSPQNVLVGVDGIARVIDFGIAKASSQTTGESTATGIIKGKVPYLAPEQLEGDPATRLTDVYAASVVMWEVLAGHRLFQGEDDGEILRKIMGMTVEAPSRYNPSVPPAVDEVVLKALARRPSDRFATAREMALALENAVHPATASVVGAWAERLAGNALAKRAAQLAEVEASDKLAGSSRPPPPSHESPSSRPPPVPGAPPSKRALSKPPPPPAPPPAAGMPPVGPMSMSFASQTVSAPAAQLSQMPDSQRMPQAQPSRPPPAMSAMPSMDETLVAPTPANGLRPPPAGALRKPALEIPNVDWLPAAEPPKEKGGLRRVLGYVLIVLALAVLVLFACAPYILKSVIVSGAQERGVALTVERVEVSRRAVKLVDVHVVSNDLPGVQMHANAVDVGIKGLRPATLAIGDVEILVEGKYGDVASRIDKYRAVQSARLFDWAGDVTDVSIASGRIDWRGAMGRGSHAMLENITFDAKKAGARPLGDDYKFSAPIVKIESSGVLAAGPWRLDTEKSAIGSTSTLRLDPSGTYPASVVWTSSDAGAMNVRFDVPRVALSDVHLPIGLLGAATIGTTKVELRGDVALAARASPGRPLQARVFAQASSLATFPGAPPVDLALDLPISGDASKPVPVTTGTLAISTTDAAATKTVQYATARMTGTIDVTGSDLTIDLSGKSTPIPCSGRGETHLEARILVPLDDIGQTTVHFVPTPSCTPRIKP